jgi:hypothetical protein
MIHARLGDAKIALNWLNRAAIQRDMNFVCAPVDRAFESLARRSALHAAAREARAACGVDAARYDAPLSFSAAKVP